MSGLWFRVFGASKGDMFSKMILTLIPILESPFSMLATGWHTASIENKLSSIGIMASFVWMKIQPYTVDMFSYTAFLSVHSILMGTEESLPNALSGCPTSTFSIGSPEPRWQNRIIIIILYYTGHVFLYSK